MRVTHILMILACVTVGGSAAQARDNNPQTNFECMLLGKCMNPEQLNKAIAAAQAFPLGTKQNPVRSDMPPGERAYLKRLRCSDGRAPDFDRAGSVGAGPYGGILDLYNLRCATGRPTSAPVYVDMYHPGYQEPQPVPGFTIAPAQ